MICFDLGCSAAHRFEGWFANAKSYQEQLESGLVTCPYCGDSRIAKMLSAPNVGRKSNQMVSGNPHRAAGDLSPAGPSPAGQADIEQSPGQQASNGQAAADQAPTGLANLAALSGASDMPRIMANMAKKIAELQQQMLKNSTWVGGHFAEEARAIHYGESDARPIHGETTADEAQNLHEEGIAAMPLLFPYIPPSTRN